MTPPIHSVSPLVSLVGAELLSILDETENGFVWEHIQSYAEQAHGAWLGISVKGQKTLAQSLSITLSSATDSSTKKKKKQNAKKIAVLLAYFNSYVILIINKRSN